MKSPRRCYPLFHLPLCHLQPLCHMESWLSTFGASRITDFPHSRWLTLFSIRQLVIHLQFWKSGAAYGKGYLPSRQYPHYRARGGVLAQDTQPFLIEKLFSYNVCCADGVFHLPQLFPDLPTSLSTQLFALPPNFQNKKKNKKHTKKHRKKKGK